ncbi:MAG: transcriptional regulator [Actinomycetota bacterium]|nr:transcriptional regulator [Actinomycetota bacterium]
MTHPRKLLDGAIHSPARFSVMATLNAVEKVEFGFVRDTVELSDSALSQHLTKLADAGYVEVSKVQEGRRTRTWLSATPAGRAAFEQHVALLNLIAGGHGDEPGAATEP